MTRCALLSLAFVAPALAQFDPLDGQWGKDDGRDLRVMTWNVEDGLNSQEDKAEAINQWTALAVVVAGMKPDVLVLQETADAPGGVDTVQELETVLDLFLYGGFDPFNNEQVGAYVQKYAPAFDLPHVFVSAESDGFNRNVIMSRYPFADLNGDTRSTLGDVPFIFPDEYAEGGDGGIRGFMFAEIDLPDATYLGDLVMGNAHLKAGFGGDDHDDRIKAATNVAYYVDYLFNGAGTGIPDPNEAIFDSPPAQTILDELTPVILAGDWNEDEDDNGTKGPAQWLQVAALIGGTDGTDRDRTDSQLGDAAEPFTGDTDTRGSSRLDYVCVQDSIATIRHAWIFNSGDTPNDKMPPEVLEFPGVPGLANNIASDHLPVLVDVMLPVGDKTAPEAFELVTPAPGAINVPTTPTLVWELSEGATDYHVTLALDAGLTDVVWDEGTKVETILVPEGVLDTCSTYFWGVTASNGGGQTESTPFSAEFETVLTADVDGNGVLNILDFVAFQNLFQAGDPKADVNGDGVLNILDFVAFQNLFVNGGC